MFGSEKIKKPFTSLTPSKMQSEVEVLSEQEAPKIESAVGDVLPKKRGRPRKEDLPQEFVGQRRRRFAIKKVTQIKTKKQK